MSTDCISDQIFENLNSEKYQSYRLNKREWHQGIVYIITRMERNRTDQLELF